MRRTGTHVLALSLLALVPVAGGAARAEVSTALTFNEDSARFHVGWSAFRDAARVDVGWLRHDDDAEGDVVHVGLHRVGRKGSVRAGVGGRVLGIDTDPGSDGFAVALGGFARAPMPFHTPLAVSGSAYYAPSVLAGGDLDEYLEATLGLDYSIVEGALVFVGFRAVEVEYESGREVDLDEDLVFGLTVTF